MLQRSTGDAKLAAVRMMLVGKLTVAFRFAAIGQDIVPSPTDVARRMPVIIIGGVATDIGHIVDC